ncbi:MAG: sodium:solute symporter [Bacteroidaceae bacterium]|nr:sodium:solute symporter [Bacteroidaceae bacterium]
MTIIATVLIYFAALWAVSRLTSKQSSNEAFFRADRKSPWYMVAFGMIGASISGVSFVSVPGMPVHINMYYLQMCLGFILGYFAIAFILLPIYYKLNLTTIYSYLRERLGLKAYKTGASFFLLSKITRAAVSFYVVCMLLQRFVLEPLGIPFAITVVSMVALIWLYTHRGGVKTLVWTDTFQTFCLFGALILIIVHVADALGMTIGEAVKAVKDSPYSQVFLFDDWLSKQNFWKQFLSGVFVVIVMTGLDQDMMQKNLTCKTLKEAQKDMCTYGFFFVPANLLFLCLGVLLIMLTQQQGISLPANTDDLLPMYAASGKLGITVTVLFTIGIVAACFSSADSALTALTTSYCVDIRERPKDVKLRRRAHICICLVFATFIMLFHSLNSTNVIDAIYTLCSYTYGPLLGLFAFGLFTKRMPNDRFVPYIAVASPVICYLIDSLSTHLTGYIFGYELLMLNGLLTFIGLWLVSKKYQSLNI